MAYPTDYRYTKEHEWIQVTGKIGLIGITEYAQKELGELVFVELPEVGQGLNAHDEFGTLESVKAVSELFSPVSGKVTEINEAAKDDPELLNDDPMGTWLIKLEISDKTELDELMSAAKYEDYIKEETGH